MRFRLFGAVLAAGVALVALGRVLVPSSPSSRSSTDETARPQVQIARQHEDPSATTVTSAARQSRERAHGRGRAAIAASRDVWLVSDSDPLASPQVMSARLSARMRSMPAR